jgi:ABC-2 type transport system permease protein
MIVATERVTVMVRKEFTQLFRDPRMRRVLVVAPIIQLVVFGYAVSTDIRRTPLFVVDHDGSAMSRDLVATLVASDYFRIAGTSALPRDLVDRLDHGNAVAGLEIPPGFGRDVAAGRGSVQLLFDGTNSNLATVSMGHAEGILLAWAAARAGVTRPPAAELKPSIWFNPELDSQNYNVPGVVGTIVLLICLLLTSLSIVREREIGTLEQLLVTPIRPVELILGKTIPFALVGLGELTLVTCVALLWFDVPLRGNLLVLLSGSALYLLCGLGLGLLISSVSRTQQEAFLSSFLVFMPTILLSGFMFPVDSMPEVFRWITGLNPMRHYLEIVRAVFLKGAGLSTLWPQHVALAAMATIILALAVRRFRAAHS